MLEKLALLLAIAGGVNYLDTAYTLAAMGGIGCLPLLFRGR